jgi:hypothetical protein
MSLPSISPGFVSCSIVVSTRWRESEEVWRFIGAIPTRQTARSVLEWVHLIPELYLIAMHPTLSPSRLTAILLAAWMVWAPSIAQTTASVVGVWDGVQTANGTRTLGFKGTASLLGKSVPITLSFFYSAESGKNVQGALGFDLEVSGVDKLSAFHFDDFEGPDAQTIGKNLLNAKILRTGQAPLSFSASPSGSYARSNVFMFEVSAVTRQPRSPAKSILKALTDDKAESLNITIADPHDTKLRLDFSIPVTDKRGAFKGLMGL